MVTEVQSPRPKDFDDNLLTIREAARRLGMSPETVRTWAWRRKITCIRINRSIRIPAGEIERLLDAGWSPAISNEMLTDT